MKSEFISSYSVMSFKCIIIMVSSALPVRHQVHCYRVLFVSKFIVGRHLEESGDLRSSGHLHVVEI